MTCATQRLVNALRNDRGSAIISPPADNGGIVDFRERLTSHQAQTNVQQQAREAKLEAARAKFAEAIAAFRNDLSQAADVLTEAGVPQTPIIGSSSTYSGRDSVTHYEWSGHSGWLFGICQVE